jgi:CDP-4-dehydro-6-deoxyglucose reductase
VTAPPRRIPARIDEVSPLGGRILSIRLQLAEMPEGVLAGHYVLLQHPDGTDIPFSLASPPRDLPELHLHYQATAGSEDARRVDEILGAGGEVGVSLPHGRCGIEGPLTRPLLIIAGGTGMAQARSILLEHLPDATAPVRLYWGVVRADDLYLAAELDALARQWPSFRWFAAVEAGALVDGPGRRGRAADLVTADIDAGRLELRAWDVLLAGGPPMVWGTIEALGNAGLTEARTRADVFEYAPRDDLWTRNPRA